MLVDLIEDGPMQRVFSLLAAQLGSETNRETSPTMAWGHRGETAWFESNSRWGRIVTTGFKIWKDHVLGSHVNEQAWGIISRVRLTEPWHKAEPQCPAPRSSIFMRTYPASEARERYWWGKQKAH